MVDCVSRGAARVGGTVLGDVSFCAGLYNGLYAGLCAGISDGVGACIDDGKSAGIGDGRSASLGDGTSEAGRENAGAVAVGVGGGVEDAQV